MIRGISTEIKIRGGGAPKIKIRGRGAPEIKIRGRGAAEKFADPPPYFVNGTALTCEPPSPWVQAIYDLRTKSVQN